MEHFQKKKLALFQTLINQADAHGHDVMKYYAVNMFFYYAFNDAQFLSYAEKYRNMLKKEVC